MGFEINFEQKIRIPLSDKARLIIAEDMDTFSIAKTATFINTVFENYKLNAKSSISLYLQQKEMELDRLFANTTLSDADQRIAIAIILGEEERKLRNEITEYTVENTGGKLYHLNDTNTEYLLNNCEEDKFYKRASIYVRSVIEEYCSLPFIKREKIYRKALYEKIETACKEHRILKIKANYYGKDQIFHVYPYKIVSDTFHSQSYLVCYSRKAEEEEKNKIIASFSMARLNEPTILVKTFYLNKQEISSIEGQLSKYSPAYLVGKPEQISVRLTEKGKRSYQSRLYSRPEKIEALSTENTYVFNCTQQQIYNYFLPFGPDAEIISPISLRNRFIKTFQMAINEYTQTAISR